MAREFRTSTPFADVVKANLKRSVDEFSHLNAPELPLAQALYSSHSKIDWDHVKIKEAGGMGGSMAASLYYAYITIGKGDEYLQLFGETDPKKFEEAIDTVLQHPYMSEVFYENLGRPLTTVSPARRMALQYILSHHFGDNPIRGIDMGAGAHIALPLLDSDEYLENELGKNAYSKNELVRLFGNPFQLNVTLGVGVDIQNGREDPDWLRAGIWPIASYRPIVERLEGLLEDVSYDEKRFPFVLANVKENVNCIGKIQEHTGTGGQDPQVDFVVSSFVRHQLGKDDSTQHNFSELVKDLLRQDGIWIDIGNELVIGQASMKNEVKVYKKVNGELIYQGAPIILRDQKYIDVVTVH